MKKANRSLRLSTRSSLTGLLFISPFILGFLIFFLQPMVTSIRFVFGNVSVGLDGYQTEFIGLGNLYYIFRENADYTTDLMNSVIQLVWRIPVIVIAALFFALILNQKFRGRTVVRAIFFLPVIISSGIILGLIRSDPAAGSVMSGSVAAGGMTIKSDALQTALTNAGLSSSLISNVMVVFNNLFDTMWKTGVQMIIFLAGLQSIPSSLYEASAIEGATSWENFWKITLPMLSPMIMLNVVYSIVDSFTDSDNPVMTQVVTLSGSAKYGWASAMSWVYFLVIGVIIFLILLAFRKVNAMASDTD